MTLRVHMTERSVSELGFGRRFVIWCQGCCKGCPGCVAQEAQPLDGGREVETAALAWEIILALRSGYCKGLTISGGEPTLQCGALCDLLDRVSAKTDTGVVLYSGYTYEELKKRPDAAALLSRCDVLIDGEYISAKDDGMALRGSSNQRVFLLTERYRDSLDTYQGKRRPDARSVPYGCETHYIGIPPHTSGEEELQ